MSKEEETKHKVANKVHEFFKSTHDALVIEEGRKILVSHNGTFSQELVGSLSNGVEELIISRGDKKKVVKRMFSILLEGLQNIRLHGELDATGKQLAFLLVAVNSDSYKVHMANLVQKKRVDQIRNYLDELNALDEEVVKEKYLSVLSNEFLSAKGGAGLGLITTRLKSGQLGYQFEDMDDTNDLFILKVTLPRIH